MEMSKEFSLALSLLAELLGASHQRPYIDLETSSETECLGWSLSD